jgi:thiosulfate/3-mercaptopyruvate sulfurtransferase
LELYEKIYVKASFLETDHGKIPCQNCHGGNPGDDDWKTVHNGLTKDPTYPNPTEACGECHEDIVASAVNSLHFTLRPMKETIHKRIGDEDAETRNIIDEAMDKHCLVCHASCGQCHVSRPDYADGGFLAAHRFVKQPSMDTTCASCHGGRVYGEYTGAKDDYEADVHYENEEMVCMDCHKSTEMHASASMVTTRLDLIEQPTCESCHSATTKENTENRSHAIHRNKVACQVCHSQTSKSCFSCHVGTDKKNLPYFKCKETRIVFKIGLHPAKTERRPYDYVVVRHPPVAPQTFDTYVKNGLAHFDDLPTWKPSFPHNIKRITRQNQKCNNCHGNESIFLSKADLATWETLANIGVVVPENRIPKRIEEGKE